MGKWFEPPIGWEVLARSWRASVHHASAIAVKRNILVCTFKPHPLLCRSDFAQRVTDYLVFGNLYALEVKNRLGRTTKLDPSPARFSRRGSDLESFCWVPSCNQEIQRDNVIHQIKYDINQEIHGLPEYLSAMNSAWLNESATLFRRKHYLNGSHAGFILYVSEASQNQANPTR
ncbi:hypothetical protein [Paludibacterium yongneupense]|uniref:hypothetical protein n=1 Tax=Paludibacterium yongneupense TaxID=400061 RepID=UPI0004234591|nr:hypothetical protein [Paludibacterium yongneupense]